MLSSEKIFMKILIFSTAYLPLIGGAEIAVKEITDRIGDIQFDMITLKFDSRLPKFEKIGNVNVYRLGFSKNSPAPAELVKFPLKLNKIFFPVLACFKACRLHGQNKYDGVWAIMAAYAGFAAMFFKLRHPNVPYFLTLQEGDPIPEIKKKARLVSGLFKKIFVKADFIQVISNYLADFARAMGYKGELAVVPNGVDIEKFKNQSAAGDNKTLITASRLVKKNAVDDIIKSLKYLPANVKLMVLGDGPDADMLKNLVGELGLGDRVVSLGQVSHNDLPQYLAKADIFIRPSLSEGQGISFIEAMAAGVPVITTPVGGIIDFLRDGETGLFCKVKNPESIAEKVKVLLADKELAEKIKNNALIMVKKDYDWNLIAEKIKNIFFKKL